MCVCAFSFIVHWTSYLSIYYNTMDYIYTIWTTCTFSYIRVFFLNNGYKFHISVWFYVRFFLFNLTYTLVYEIFPCEKYNCNIWIFVFHVLPEPRISRKVETTRIHGGKMMTVVLMLTGHARLLASKLWCPEASLQGQLVSLYSLCHTIIWEHFLVTKFSLFWVNLVFFPTWKRAFSWNHYGHIQVFKGILKSSFQCTCTNLT